MKKYFYYLCAVAATFAAASCTKTIETAPTAPKGERVEFAIAEEVETKTAVSVEDNVIKMKWDNTPNSYVHLFEKTDEGTDSRLSVDSKGKGTITAVFINLDLLGKRTYHAVVASDYKNGIATIPSVQNPAADSFDPAADVLVGKSDEYNYRPVKDITRTTPTLRFARLNAINRIQFTGLGNGEKVQYIQIEAANNIAGPLKALKDFEFDGYGEGTKIIVLKYDKDNVIEGNAFTTFFTSWAVKAGSTFKITVVTDKKYYEKTATNASALEFKTSVLGNINVNMSGKGVSRITPTLSFASSSLEWVIKTGGKEYGKAYDGARLNARNYASIEYSSSNEKIATVDNTGKVTPVSEGRVTITATAVESMKYLGATASYDIIITTPCYRRIKSTAELTAKDKYIIVSKVKEGLLFSTTNYYAFNAANTGSYATKISVTDNGEKIVANETTDSYQVTLDKDILSKLDILGLAADSYTITPAAVGKYMFSNITTSTILDQEVPLPSYEIAFGTFANFNIFNRDTWDDIITMPHTIKFDENGIVSIRSSKNSIIKIVGADLVYSRLNNKYSYIDLEMFDNFESVAELLAYFGQDTQYAWLINIIKALGENVSVRDIMNYFSGELYLFKYID